MQNQPHQPSRRPRIRSRLQAFYQRISDVLVVEHGWRRLPGRDGRPKIRGQCLFHDDDQPSADFYADDGWYYCHACAATSTVEAVAEALALDWASLQVPSGEAEKNGQPEAGRAFMASRSDPGRSNQPPHYHTRFGSPSAVYAYRFPETGRISHYKLRYELDPRGKTFAIQDPDGSWRKPDSNWPIYGDYGLPCHLNLVVAEGEKAQQYITGHPELYQGVLISAITAGSAADLKSPQVRKTLIDRLQQLKPLAVLVWPDNDKPGQEWAIPLHRQAKAMGLPCALVNTQALPIEHGEGADDFMANGGSLEQVFEREFQQVGGSSVDDLIDSAVVTDSEKFLLAGTRKLYPLTIDNAKLLHYGATKKLATHAIAERIYTELRFKAANQGVPVCYRRWHDSGRTRLAWRSLDTGFAYHASAEGQEAIKDPPGALLLLPGGTTHISPRVEDGTRKDLEELCVMFGLDRDNTTFVEGWLMCAMLGLQTPILLLRGEAGSGKTTLARILVGVIEPTVPTINLQDKKDSIADRALVEGLRQSIAVLIDNVSSFSSNAEDLLCQFVTGFSIIHRQLYENRVENLSMQRAIVITTTNYDVRKGDLASRLMAIRMNTKQSFTDEDRIYRAAEPLIERIRGHLLQSAVRYYQNADKASSSSLRIAGLGKVFSALGYDTERLEMRLASRRGEVVNESDEWFLATIDWFRSLDLKVGQSSDRKLEELKGVVSGALERLSITDRQFVVFLNEALPRFRDFGFTLERRRTSARRFWRVTCLRDIADEGDDEFNAS